MRAWLKALIQSEKPQTHWRKYVQLNCRYCMIHILHKALRALDRKWAMNNVCLCVSRQQRFRVKLGDSKEVVHLHS